MTRYFVAVAILSWFLLPASSMAEHVRVQLKDGGTASGQLKEYVPGDHLTIDVGDGKLLRVASSSALSVEIGPDVSVATPTEARPDVAAVPSQVVLSVTLQNLLDERRYWETRYTGVLLPLTLIPIGATLLVTGGVIFSNRFNLSPCPTNNECLNPTTANIGKGLMIGGALAMAAGLAVLPLRTSKRRQRNELNRINERLQALGVQASLAPWFAPRTPASSGMSAGLVSTFRY